MPSLKYLWFIFFILVSFQSFSQHGIVPYYARGTDYQKHSGYIKLNNNQQIEGIFQFADGNLKSFSKKGKLIKWYKIKNIKKVVLAGSDTTLTSKDSTYFEVLGKHKGFYRQLTFGPIEVYDNFFDVNEKKGLIKPLLFLRSNNQLHELNSSEKFIKWMKANYPNKIKWHKNITLEEIVRQLNGKALK